MATLLGPLGEVDRAGLSDWALIGGLAVMVRLENAHRPTRDIDTLSRQVDPEPKLTLLGIAESATTTGVVLADGTKVDVIGVDPRIDLDALPEDVHQTNPGRITCCRQTSVTMSGPLALVADLRSAHRLARSPLIPEEPEVVAASGEILISLDTRAT